MKSITDNALVLRRKRHLENDYRLTVFLREHGKFSLVSKGTALLKSKLKALQQPFSELDIQVYVPPQGTNGRLVSGKLIRSFERLRDSYEGFLVASACCEVVDMLIPFRAPSPEVFDILRDAFSHLESSQDIREDWIRFCQALLKSLGHGDISEKLSDGSSARRFDVALGELEQILPWRLKSDMASLRQQSVVQQK